MDMVSVGISCMHWIAYHTAHFHGAPFNSPLISIVSHLLAHPSPLQSISCWPMRLHCATYTSSFISIASHLLAHSSPLCLIYRPTYLYYTLSLVGPLISIIHCHSQSIIYYIVILPPILYTTGPSNCIRYTPPSGPLVYHSILIAIGPHRLAHLY